MAVPDSRSFSIGEALSFGWKRFQVSIGPLAVAALAVFVLGALFGLLGRGGGFAGFLFGLIWWFLSILISMGWIRMSLKIVDGERAEVADLFQRADQAPVYFVASLIVGIAVGIGFVLLIIPGIYLAITFAFFGYNIVDKEHGIIQSIEQSAAITRGRKWDLFAYGVVLVFFNLLGLLALGVGVLITAPVSLLATAYVYRRLSGEPIPE